MNFFKSILPSTIPPHLVGKTTKEIALEKILQRILLVASSLFIFLSVLSLTALMSNGNGENLVIWGFASILVVLTLLRRLPFNVRATPVLFAIFVLGVGFFLLNGLTGAGIAFLIVFSLLTGVLLGRKGQIISFVIVVIAYLAIAYGMTNSIRADIFPVFELNNRAADSWRFVFAIFVIVLTTSSLTVSSLINELEISVSQQEALGKELQQEQESLTIRVQERTMDLQRRSAQLRAIADISRNISSLLDQEIMFQQVVNLLKERLDLYYAGIFIIEETGQFAVLKAGTGEAGRQMIANGHRLEVGGTSMIGWSVINRMPRIALDVGAEAVRFSNPLLPETRSELALPIISKDNAIGALTIQSEKPNAFDEEDILIFQGISDSLSVSLENARLFQQTQDNLNEIRFLSRQYLQDSWGSFMQTSNSLTSAFENPLVTAPAETYSHTIPVFLRNEPIGEIVLETADEVLSPEDQQLIDSITAQAVISLESARLLQETRRQAIQEEKINQISAQFTNAFDIQDVLETALKEISQLPSVSEIAVHLVPPDSQSNNNGKEANK